MYRHRIVLVTLVLAALVAAACQSTGTAPPGEAGDGTSTSTTTVDDATSTGGAASAADPDPTGPATGQGPSDAAIAGALAKIDTAYRNVQGVWDGYRPRDHPVVLAWKSPADELIGAVAINHPDPTAIGRATPVALDADALGRAHRIDDLDPEAAETLAGVAAFEFETTIGGVDSFAMVAGGSDGFFDPEQLDYASTLLHELFHRYQIKTFAGDDVGQDVEGYDYGAENLAMAALEERALVAALEAENDTARDEGARGFAAIRKARLAADYGFGRSYATGAAVLRLLDQIGVEGVAPRVEGGESPAAILADAVGVSDADVADLVADARSVYDPDGELAALAAEAAETAKAEGPIFGGDGDGDGGDGDGVGGSGGDGGLGGVLTEDELTCLEEKGIDVGGDEIEISDDVFEACLS